MKFKILITTLLISIIALLIYYGSFLMEPPKKIGYIQNAHVYNEFSMTKELDQQLENYVNAQQAVLDSLELELNLMAKRVEQGQDTIVARQFLLTKQEYQYRKENFFKNHEQLVMSYQEEITTQMNQYIKEYSEQHEFHYLFGANGSGTIMYATELEDYSTEVIQFINLKYDGKG